jgi:hypothetical protein
VTLHHTEVATKVLGLGPGEQGRYAIALGYPDLGAEAAARQTRRAAGRGGGRRAAEQVIRHADA